MSPRVEPFTIVRLRAALARASKQYGRDAPETAEARDRYVVALFAERIGADLTESELATLGGLVSEARSRTPNHTDGSQA